MVINSGACRQNNQSKAWFLFNVLKNGVVIMKSNLLKSNFLKTNADLKDVNMNIPKSDKPRLIVVGGGFGGVDQETEKYKSISDRSFG
jgi:hypothetical protein